MTVQNFLSNFFLNPAGLLALLSIIPLMLFYMMKPEPEEQIMPSLAFFMQNRNSGKVQQAIQRLMRNLMLLFHILFLLGFAAALAQPYLETPTRADSTVIVLDRSASMQDDLDDATKFIKSNLGDRNTLIVADEEIRVMAEEASPARIKAELRKIETRDVRTDVAGALEIASGYPGPAVVASDLDQTVNSRNPVENVEKMRDAGRNVRILDASRKNSWGVVEVKPGRTNSSVGIKNFRNKTVSVPVKVNGKQDRLSIDSNEVRTLTFSPEKGRNTVKLAEDELGADNTAYISIPRKQSFQVTFIRDSSNPYFEKAVELIPFTDLRTVSPPVDSVEGDIYVIGETSRLLRTTVESIKKDVKKGSSLVVFGQESVFNRGFQSLPVKKTGGRINTTVSIKKPVRTSIQTRVFETNKTSGSSLSEPDTALVKAGYGRGQVLFYNIRDGDFNQEFLYPVFWKRVFDGLTGRPDTNQLNIRTGSEINHSRIITPDGEEKNGALTVEDSGFYNSSAGVYAANLESYDESDTETVKLGSSASTPETTTRNLQNFAAAMLAVLALLELLYLIYAGDLADD